MAEGVQNPKVLIVDDEPNIRELVQVALDFHGFAVATGATGDDALNLADAYDPDLIAGDVLLPDIDGFEVCRRLRAGANDVPVIFLTAKDATSDAVNGLTIGGGGRDGAGTLSVADLELDEAHWTVRRAGTQVELVHIRRGVGYSLHLP